MTPDLSLCLWRNTCPLAPLCYRAVAEPDEWHQSWFAPTRRPRNPGDTCRYYMPANSAGEVDKKST
jgi:hypothetical protein